MLHAYVCRRYDEFIEVFLSLRYIISKCPIQSYPISLCRYANSYLPSQTAHDYSVLFHSDIPIFSQCPALLSIGISIIHHYSLITGKSIIYSDNLNVQLFYNPFIIHSYSASPRWLVSWPLSWLLEPCPLTFRCGPKRFGR